MSRYHPSSTYPKQNDSKTLKDEDTKSYSKEHRSSTTHKVVPTKEPIYHSRPGQEMPSFDAFEPSITPAMDMMAVQTVRPVIASRNVIINRTVADPFNRGSRNYQSERTHLSTINSPLQPGSLSGAASSGVEAVVESRGKEKKDMQDLNGRLANYLEKVRFLEAQNRNLATELERLKDKWGKETSQVKAMYQTELDEARKVLDEAVKEKGKLEIKVASMEDVIEELREKLDEAKAVAEDWKQKWQDGIQRVSDAEAETMASKRMMEGLGMERERERKGMSKLKDLLSNARMDLDNESYRHLEAASKLQTLEEELAFLKAVHQQEMEEMSALVSKDTTVDNRKFWKSEMGQAMKEIQELYDSKLDEVKVQCETTYATKVQELKTGVSRRSMEAGQSREENKRLKSSLIDLRNRLSVLEGQNLNMKREVDGVRKDGEERERELETEKLALKGDILKMRSEMDAIMMELQHLMDSKMGLELEICAYRKMLEGEEHRVDDLEAHLKKARTAGMRGYDGESVNKHSSHADNEKHGGNQDGAHEEYSAFRNQSGGNSREGVCSFQRSCKGPCVIAEASEDGRSVVLENTGRREESLGGCVLKRYIKDKETASYAFQQAVTIKPNSQIKIWARGYRPRSSANDLEMSLSSWGRGQEASTKLYGPNGEEKASLTQSMNN